MAAATSNNPRQFLQYAPVIEAFLFGFDQRFARVAVLGGVFAKMLSIQLTQFHQHRPQLNAFVCIHLKHPRGGPAHRRFACDARSVTNEMFRPLILAWIKQPHDVGCVRVASGEIRALVKVALLTGQRQILKIVRAAVFARDDGST